MVAMAVERNGGGVEIPAGGLRLNIGSGKYSLDGYVNIDAAVSPNAPRAPDIVCDVKKIPLPDACAIEVMGIHIFEHLYRWECDEAIREWWRLMRPAGVLILEMPDLLKFCANILEGRNDRGRYPDQLGMWAMYGDPKTKDPLMCHRWGWTFKTLSEFLWLHGFKKCRETQTQWHPIGRGVRDFRIEALKE
jgi:hypothetical protein